MLGRLSENEGLIHITNPSASVTWAETCVMMNDLYHLYEKHGQSPIMLSLRECIHLQNNLEQKKELILKQAEAIKARIQSATDKCCSLLQGETEKLKNHQRNLDDLQTELDRIIHKRNDLQNQLKEVNNQIHVYTTEASQEIEEFDAIEMEKRDEVPKLKKQLSMHATATGIKWDYDRTDALAGEVSLPSIKVMKRFCIDLNDHSNFEAANKVWDILDASSS